MMVSDASTLAFRKRPRPRRALVGIMPVIAHLAGTASPANSLALIEIGEAISARIGTLARVLSGASCLAGTITFVPFPGIGGGCRECYS
jgi:hypothetical protein